MADLSGLVEGLSKGLTSYLQAGQQQQRQQQNFAFQQQQEQQTHATEGQTDIDQAGKVTPDMAEQLIPGASKWIQSFQQQNNRLPTIKEANDGLLSVQEKLKALENKNKPTKKSYAGNDEEGNPILSDTEGKFYNSEGQPYTGKILPKSSTMPTSTTRSSAEFASTLMPHLDRLDQLIDQADKAGLVGPVKGRIFNDFLAGKIGSTGDPKTDALLGELRAFDSLAKSGTLKVHFGSRGGQQMYEKFNDMLNSGKQSATSMHGAIAGIRDFMKGYAQAGDVGQLRGGESAPESVDPKDPLGILK